MSSVSSEEIRLLFGGHFPSFSYFVSPFFVAFRRSPLFFRFNGRFKRCQLGVYLSHFALTLIPPDLVS
jgi:hypothetical protein